MSFTAGHLILSDAQRSFGVTHYVILNVILYAFYKLNCGQLTFFSLHS